MDDRPSRQRALRRRGSPSSGSSQVSKFSRTMESESRSVSPSHSGEITEVAGRLVRVEIENFMCHGNFKVDFDVQKNNCFYIGGPNGSGKSSLFSAINIGLGGGGRNNDRGNAVKKYIKTGKNKAKIRIILTNTGEGRCMRYKNKDGAYEDYGEYIVVERNIGMTSSSYSIKTIRGYGRDKHEYHVSNAKSDLDIILARFGIELNNPIYWLSQNNARMFLSQTDPTKMFKIFMDASELDKTKLEYEKAEEILKQVNKNITFIHDQLVEQRKEFTKMRELIEKKKKEQEVVDELQRLNWLSYYAPLRDAENKKFVMEKKLKTIHQKFRELKQQHSDTAREMQDYREALNNVSEKTAVNKLECDERHKHMRLLNDDIDPIEMDCKHLKRDIKKFRDDIQSAENDIQEATKKIQDNARRMASNVDRQNMDKYKKAIEDNEQMQNDEKEKRKEIVEAREHMEQQMRHSHAIAQNASQTAYAARDEYRALSDELRMIENSETNRLARFGDDVLNISNLIEQNAGRFSQKPKGPIGSYIHVRDKKWLLPVEWALRNNLKTYMFDNYQDEKLFKQILNSRKIRLPQTVIARFGLPPHDTCRNEPEGYLTIMKAINIADNDVRNLLIDLQSIESILLFNTDQEAKDVMNGHMPDKCTMGYTATGGQAYGVNGTSRGTYRFYACHRQRAQMLSDSTSINKDQLRQQVQIAKRKREIAEDEARKAHTEFQSLKKRCNDLEQQQIEVEETMKRLKGEIIQYNRLVESLQDRDDGDAFNQAQERLIDEFHEIIQDRDKKIKEKENELKKKIKRLEHLKQDREKFKEESNRIMEDYKLVESEAVGYQLKITLATEKNTQCDKKMRQLEDQEKQITDVERVTILREIDSAKELAEKYDEGVPEGEPDVPNFNDMPSTVDIMDMVKKKTIELDAMRKTFDIVPSVDEMNLKKENFNEAKVLYGKLKSLHAQVSQCLAIRQKKFPVIQHAIIMRLKNEFARLIKFKFAGELSVNVLKKEIKIKVKPHSDSTQTSSSSAATTELKDIRGLSGGERSYTTTCFFMALWDIMETPFRCMDEFDVFMDGHMRKTAMDLIVKLATENYSHQQFIFFTPQGINELSMGDRVATLEMPIVERNIN